MAQHDKCTFTAEYCRCRGIPYRIKNESLFIAGRQICFSLYNFTYGDIVNIIDDMCEYDWITQKYIRLSKGTINEYTR